MLPVVLDSDYREKTGTNIEYKPYQFLPFKEIFDKTENGFALKEEEGNRLIIKDDHGIGIKTEVGIIVSQLLANDPDLRVMILTYSDNLLIWEKEMYDHFGLGFQIYDNTDKHNSDLLIVYYDDYNDNIGEFDVQIIYGLNYYGENYIAKMRDRINSGNTYRLRIFIDSDCLIDDEDKKNIPCTNTSASTVSSFNINKSMVECEGNKSDSLINYLKQKKGYFRAVINTFTKNTKDVEAVLKEAEDIKKIFKVFSFSNQRELNEVIEFRKTSRKALLVCGFPFGLDLSFCRTALFYDTSKISDSKDNGLICKANRKGDVDIVYFADTPEDKEAIGAFISDHEKKLKTKEQDLKKIEAEVEEFLSSVNGSENAADKKRLEELRGEKQ